MYKLGDSVLVNGIQNGMTFYNAKGIVVDSEFSREGHVAVDFARAEPDTYRYWGSAYAELGTNSFHDICGKLSKNTGYWIDLRLLKLSERKKIGFGKFISRIEERNV